MQVIPRPSDEAMHTLSPPTLNEHTQVLSPFALDEQVQALRTLPLFPASQPLINTFKRIPEAHLLAESRFHQLDS